MSDIFPPSVCATFLEGNWYITGSKRFRMMISGPTLTEAIAAFVVAVAHAGHTDPVAWQLSPFYSAGPDDDEVDPDNLTAEEWDELIREGLVICDGDRQAGGSGI